MQEVYKGFSFLHGHINVATPWTDGLRWLEYIILSALAQVLDLMGKAVNSMLGINLVSKIPAVNTFATQMSSVGWGVLTISLIAVGIYFIVWGKQKQTFQHLFFAVLLMIAIPFIFTQLDSLQAAGIKDLSGQLSENGNVGETMLKGYILDLSQSRQDKSLQYLKNVKGGISPYGMDINARLPSGYPWDYKVDHVVGNDKSGYKLMGEHLGTGFFGLGAEQLYSYDFSFLLPIFSFIIMIIAITLSGFKIGKVVFDLLFHKVIASVVFASDINDGTRTKKYINNLIALYIMLILTMVVFKIFIDASQWINANVTDILPRIFYLGGCAWGCIEGPDIVMRLLGVDVGTQNAAQTAMAGMMGVNAAAGAIKGAGHMVGGALNGAAGAAGGLSAIRGIKNAFSVGRAEKEKEDGGFASTAEYSNSLAKERNGRKGFWGGAIGVSNAAKTLGYMTGKRPPQKTDSESGSNKGKGSGSSGNDSKKGTTESTSQTPPPESAATGSNSGTGPEKGSESGSTSQSSPTESAEPGSGQQSSGEFSPLTQAFDAAKGNDSPPPPPESDGTEANDSSSSGSDPSDAPLPPPDFDPSGSTPPPPGPGTSSATPSQRGFGVSGATSPSSGSGAQASGSAPHSASSARASGSAPHSASSARATGPASQSAPSAQASGPAPHSASSARATDPASQSAPSAQASGPAPHSASSARATGPASQSAPSAQASGPAPHSTSKADSASSNSTKNAIPHGWQEATQSMESTPQSTFGSSTYGSASQSTSKADSASSNSTENAIPHGWQEATQSVESDPTAKRTFWPKREERK